MKKLLLTLFLFGAFTSCVWADSNEVPNFSLMFHTGAEMTTGFITGSEPAPELGAWMGVGISQRFDGFFALDYFGMPNIPMTLSGPASYIFPNPKDAGTTLVVQPTDDVAISVNIRWYPFNDKWDFVHRRYNTSFYLVSGTGLDLMVDAPLVSNAPSSGFPIVTNGYDILWGMNIGAGVDFPLDNGREVSLYTEGLDHLIFWQGLTQVFDGRFGVRFMLDTAHVDPFR